MNTTKVMTVPGAVVAAVVVAAALHHQFTVEAAPPRNSDTRRAYYVTKTTHPASEALTACAAGYHMASVYEIAWPSTLRYETTLGEATPDSGSGPPTADGWARNGGLGVTACSAWTSDVGQGHRAVFAMTGLEGSEAPPHLNVVSADCASPGRVWCIQD